MIELKNVHKAYGPNVLFNDVSYCFDDGQRYLIQGDNGVGKSVLLIMVGYASCDKGEILDDGKAYEFLKDAGVSINAPEFMDHYTGLENLLEIAKIKKVVKKEDILHLGQLFELDLHKKYKTYSLGMRQKMRLIQAVMEHPRYLILDEPFDGLDSKMKRQVASFLKEYINEDTRRLLIYTSHDEHALDLATCVVSIQDAKLCER